MDEIERKEFCELVLQEITTMKNLDHKNIVRIIEAITDPWTGCPISVMEIFDCSLKAYLIAHQNDTEGRIILPPSLFHDLLDGLDYLHQKKIPHGNIKTENVLIRLNGTIITQIVWTDIGISSRLASDVAGSSIQSPHLTAPEMRSNSNASSTNGHLISADLYLLGMMIYEMCSPNIQVPEKLEDKLDFFQLEKTDYTDVLKNAFQQLTQIKVSMRLKLDTLRDAVAVVMKSKSYEQPVRINDSDDTVDILTSPPLGSSPNRPRLGSLGSSPRLIVDRLFKLKPTRTELKGVPVEAYFRGPATVLYHRCIVTCQIHSIIFQLLWGYRKQDVASHVNFKLKVKVIRSGMTVLEFQPFFRASNYWRNDTASYHLGSDDLVSTIHVKDVIEFQLEVEDGEAVLEVPSFAAVFEGPRKCISKKETFWDVNCRYVCSKDSICDEDRDVRRDAMRPQDDARQGFKHFPIYELPFLFERRNSSYDDMWCIASGKRVGTFLWMERRTQAQFELDVVQVLEKRRDGEMAMDVYGGIKVNVDATIRFLFKNLLKCKE
eukprot:TRINITY_DN5102_c0_g1_i1.p1 TRINITY_DN5102_c0_g1~~TRINITY_DN5102_c0_g1_i1.p1  ORF type:complete len:627 (-),score=178.63 TRINITY_DN5102_c0_g1_i1:15-1655(-)